MSHNFPEDQNYIYKEQNVSLDTVGIAIFFVSSDKIV
jgi:hypothetical protein